MNDNGFLPETSIFSNLPDVTMTISQYDYQDQEIGRHTGTFNSVFDNIPDFDRFYYRVTALGKTDIQNRLSTSHFGVRTTSIGGFNVSEESFLNAYLNYNVKDYALQKACGDIRPEDFNFAFLLIHDFWFLDRMRTLRQNTSSGFQDALDTFLKNFTEFKSIVNLDEVKEKRGIYLLVLDDYNVCYLGQARNIRQRIMRHWSRNDYFTGTGIDMFKARDTTRVYVAFTDKNRKTNALEHQVIDAMPSRYTLNCLAGGDIDFLADHALSISKKPCRDDDYVNYVLQDYDIVERIKESSGRFIIESIGESQ